MILCKMAAVKINIIFIPPPPPPSLLAFIQVCDESPCGEGESCGLQAGSYICVNCSTSEENQDNRCSHLTLNPCIFGPCTNGGRCELRSNNTFACVCSSDFCNNGGTCEKLSNNTFACTCPPGYTGATCEIPSKQYRVCVIVLGTLELRTNCCGEHSAW